MTYNFVLEGCLWKTFSNLLVAGMQVILFFLIVNLVETNVDILNSGEYMIMNYRSAFFFNC